MKLDLQEAVALAEKLSDTLSGTITFQMKVDKGVLLKVREKLKYHDVNFHDFFSFVLSEFSDNLYYTEKLMSSYIHKKYNVEKSHAKDKVRKTRSAFNELEKESIYNLINKELKEIKQDE